MGNYEKAPVNYSEGSLLYQYAATITGTLVAVASGMHFGWPSPSLPQLLSEDSPIPITSSDGSWIAVMPCIGAPLGALLGACIVDKIGRKLSLILISPFQFVAWLAIAFSTNLIILHVARFTVGIMDGIIFTVLPMYVGEISDRRIRGRLGCSVSVTFVLGFLLINLLGLYCSIKTTALISSVVPVLHFVTFYWMPESPYYYLIKNKNHKAASKLRKLTGVANVDEELSKLSVDNNSHGTRSTHLKLFNERSNRKALAITCILRLIQQFSGNYAISFYCLIIFREAGGYISDRSATLIYFSVQTCASVLSLILVDKTGRRPLLIISVIGSAFALCAQGVYFYLKNETKTDISMLGFLPLTALLLYNLLYSIGLGTIPVLMLGELFPTDVKAFALCFVDIFYSAVIVIASKFFQIVNDEFGMYVPFLTFSSFCLVGFIYIILCVPETKGKSLEEVQRELKGQPPLYSIELKQVENSLLTGTYNKV